MILIVMSKNRFRERKQKLDNLIFINLRGVSYTFSLINTLIRGERSWHREMFILRSLFFQFNIISLSYIS